MAPKPQLVTEESELIRPRGRARRRLRRWPMIWTLLFAVAASLLLWSGIIASIGALIDAFS
jgi:hypothetical protein